MIEILKYSENFQGNSVFLSKRKLLKNPGWWKIYFQYSEFRATLFFRASASCSKVLNDKKYMFNTVKIFRATLFFRASASCSKSWMWKIYSIQWNISGQTLSYRASACCSKIL